MAGETCQLDALDDSIGSRGGGVDVGEKLRVIKTRGIVERYIMAGHLPRHLPTITE